MKGDLKHVLDNIRKAIKRIEIVLQRRSDKGI